jgi:hypothetical protein
MSAFNKLSKVAAWGTAYMVLGTASTAFGANLTPDTPTLQQQLNALGINSTQITLIEQTLDLDANNPYIPVSLGGRLFSTGKDIAVSVLPNTASFTSTLLYLVPELNLAGVVATNHDIGTVKNIGSFDAGVELIFGILVHNTGNFFVTGPGSRNLDGVSHAMVNFSAPGLAKVGFEDLFGGGDRNYNDNVFVMSGGIDSQSVPEPTTILGSLAFGTFAARWRMKRKKTEKSLNSTPS